MKIQDSTFHCKEREIVAGELASKLRIDGHCKKDIAIRIDQAKAAFGKSARYPHPTNHIKTRESWSISLYGYETWTMLS